MHTYFSTHFTDEKRLEINCFGHQNFSIENQLISYFIFFLPDPTFRTQFLVEAKDSNVIIIFHSTLDLNQFVSQVDIQKVKLTNQNLVVYHVTPAIKESELVYIQPSQIISFDMGKDDIAKYVHNRLQLLTHDKSR